MVSVIHQTSFALEDGTKKRSHLDSHEGSLMTGISSRVRVKEGTSGCGFEDFVSFSLAHTGTESDRRA